MMLMPCWPSAGPTGCAGVALPAGSCSVSTALTRLDNFYSFEVTGRCGLRKRSPRPSQPAPFLELAPAEIRTHGGAAPSLCQHVGNETTTDHIQMEAYRMDATAITSSRPRGSQAVPVSRV